MKIVNLNQRQEFPGPLGTSKRDFFSICDGRFLVQVTLIADNVLIDGTHYPLIEYVIIEGTDLRQYRTQEFTNLEGADAIFEEISLNPDWIKGWLPSHILMLLS